MKFYSLEADIFDTTAWSLGDINRGDLSPGGNWRFVQPPMIPMNNSLRENAMGPFRTRLEINGRPMDYTVAGYAGVPIGKLKVVRSLSGLEGFTAFPVVIEGFPQRDLYHILHFWDVVDCFDERHSVFEVFSESDPVFLDRAGDYCSVTKLIIDSDKTQGKHIFRIARLESRIAVSEVVKDRFESAGVTGAVFECLSLVT